MATSKTSETASLLSEGNNSLCMKLYAHLRNHSKGNIFYSPTSLEFALALVYIGAEGNTAKEIQSVLNLPQSKERTQEAVSASLNLLTAMKNVTLNIANGLFVQEKFDVRQSFVDAAKKYFASKVTNVNFVEPEAAEIINNFVAKETNQKITKLFDSDSFDSMTRLVIANAIYFKGNWANKFNPSLTFKGDFHLNKNDKVTVDFMKNEGNFLMKHMSDLGAQIVILPYKGQEMSMVLVVPDEIDGLKAVEDKIIGMDLMSLTEDAYSSNIILSMPKFKLQDSLNLKKILCEMGMTEMFGDRANLTGVAEQPLFVSDVTQKTCIEVNEEGAEAAAVTGVVVQTMCLPMDFIVDRPFLYFIQDNRHRMVTFFGRLKVF